jgi:hypothetical protein
MKKTDKKNDKRGKKSGEIAEEKLDKVAGGATAYQLSMTAGSIYETSTKLPTAPTYPKPILKP